MDQKSIQKTVTAFVRRIPKKYTPEKIVLFGSRVRGDAKKTSDIDVIVVSKAFVSISEDDRLYILYKASAFLTPEIHPWAVTPEEYASLDPQTTLGAAKKYGEAIL